jgi:hypothetical protein
MAVRAKSSNFAVHKKYNCFYGYIALQRHTLKERTFNVQRSMLLRTTAESDVEGYDALGTMI